jgi:hypothetical protein
MFCRDHAARDRIKWSVFQYATYGRPVLHDAYRLGGNISGVSDGRG